MKKRYFFLATFGLFLGLVAENNHWFEDERDIYFPITKEQLQSKVKSTKLAKLNQTAVSAPLLLEKMKQPKSLQQADLQSEYFDLVKLYFFKNTNIQQSLTSQAQQNQLETQHKLTFLMSFKQAWLNTSDITGFPPNHYSQFLIDLSRNQKEPLLVRRQAYKNWLSFNKSENTHSNERLAQLVSFSDRQLIDSLTSEEN